MIKVYTTPTCPWCHVLMEWLDEHGVEYEEVDATTVPDITSVPVLDINGERIVGFDRHALEDALPRMK